MTLSPSLLAADFVNLSSQLDILVESGVNTLHFDVMDGDFVPALSFGEGILADIKRKYGDKIFLDVHFMVTEGLRFAETFAKAGADHITIHVEACKHLDRAIEAVKATGAKVGVALNPATPISSIEEIAYKLDLVLIMSVNPGFGGQKFIEASTDKIARLKKYRDEHGYNFSIQVDGGITPDNVEKVMKAGADNFVAGSAVFKNDIAENCRKFFEVLKA